MEVQRSEGGGEDKWGRRAERRLQVRKSRKMEEWRENQKKRSEQQGGGGGGFTWQC